MEATIKINPQEFSLDFFDKIKQLIHNQKDVSLTISINNSETKKYWTKIDDSITELQQGKGTIFTMDSLHEFINSKN